MIILGIDPGSRTTGYGFLRVEGNHFRLLDAGPIHMVKQGAIPQRLYYLSERIDTLIRTFEPDVLAIEKVFHGVNFQSALLLGYARGVILMQAAHHDLNVAEYAATEVKKAVTGYGRAEKSQVQEMVRILLNLRDSPKPTDVADALAAAICHAHAAPVAQRFGMGNPNPKKH